MRSSSPLTDGSPPQPALPAGSRRSKRSADRLHEHGHGCRAVAVRGVPGGPAPGHAGASEVGFGIARIDLAAFWGEARRRKPRVEEDDDRVEVAGHASGDDQPVPAAPLGTDDVLRANAATAALILGLS